MRNSFTVDVEEWFHICGVAALDSDRWNRLPSRVVENTRDLLDLLDQSGVRATFFVLGWIAERHPELVETIAAAGHEIGSHSHLHRRVYELTPEIFDEDLRRSVAAIEAAGCAHVRGFRAPEWSINDRSLWALDVLARRGFTYDSSMAPLRLIGNPRFPRTPHTRTTGSGSISEFPPLVDRWLGQNVPLGGGWGLRMSNPSRVLATIEQRNRAGEAVALFVHPWELDPDPPRTKLPLAPRFVHYVGLAGFRDRLAQVLRGATFAPMGDVLGLTA
jgi:polysaccharide deacetylase family protein (PEP-CTERM system associated)